MEQLTMLDFIIFSLAAYRLTHLVVYDKIFEPIRDFFVKRTFEFGPNGLAAFYTLKGGHVRRFIGKMLNCHWCAGMWIAAAVILTGWHLYDWVIELYMILAVAGVQSLIETVWAKAVGFPEMQETKTEGDNR